MEHLHVHHTSLCVHTWTSRALQENILLDFEPFTYIIPHHMCADSNSY